MRWIVFNCGEPSSWPARKRRYLCVGLTDDVRKVYIIEAKPKRARRKKK